MEFCSRKLNSIKKKWKKNFFQSKLLLVVAIIEVLVVISVAIARVSYVQNCWDGSKVVDCPVYYDVNQSVAIWLWSLFLILNIYDGIFNDNLYNLYSAMFQACYLTAWSIFRFAQPNPNAPIDYVFLLSTCVPQVLYFVLAFFLYKDFDYRFHNKAGSDEKTQAIYKTYQVWMSFSRLDVVYSICSTALSGEGVFNVGVELGMDILMAIYTFVFFIVGYYAITREMRSLLMFYVFLFPFGLAYEGYFLYDDWKKEEGPDSDFVVVRMTILYTASAVVAIICRLVLAVLTYFAYKNFGKGLKKSPFMKTLSSDISDDDLPTDTLTNTTLPNDNEYVNFESATESKDNLSILDVIRKTNALGQGAN